MNKKIVMCLILASVFGCAKPRSNGQPDNQAPALATQQTSTATAAKTSAVTQSTSTPTSTAAPVSPQTVEAIEAMVLCRTPIALQQMSNRLMKEGVIGRNASNKEGGKEYKPAMPLSVLGFPVSAILFAGNDESDYSEFSLSLGASSDAVVKALGAKKIKLKKDPQSANALVYKSKNGKVNVIRDGKITHLSCSQGW